MGKHSNDASRCAKIRYNARKERANKCRRGKEIFKAMSAATLGPVDIEFLLKGLNFQQEAEKMKSQIKGVSSAAQSEAEKINNAFKVAFAGAAAYFTLDQATNFVSQLVSVRGEFQQMGIAFETMLGSKAKSDQLMAEVVNLAAKTPFTLTQVGQGAKQLLAFQVAQSDVIDTLTRLGNVASGVSVPIDRLITAYGQVKAKGKLMGDDLRQFTEAGIPMIHELAKEFGVADDQIAKMVETGKVGFKDVDKVIKNLTNTGGMFFNLMEKQSTSLTGLTSNLADAWDRMLNKIGTNNEGFLNSSIKSATYLVNNYEDVVSILKVLIATYGAYKAAVIVNNLVEQANAAGSLAAALKNSAIAQQLFNLAQKASPVGIVFAGLTALIGGVIAYNKAIGDTKTATQEINQSIAGETFKLTGLFSALKNAGKGTEERNRYINAINSTYGSYLGNLLTEKSTLEDIEKAQQRATSAMIADIATKESKKKIDEVLSSYNEKLQDTFGDFNQGMATKKAPEVYAAYLTALNEAIEKQAELSSDELKRGALKSSEIANDLWNTYIQDISKQTGYLKYDYNDFQDAFIKMAKVRTDLKTPLAELQGIMNAYGGIIKKETGGNLNDPNSSVAKKKTYEQELDDKKKQYELYLSWLEVVDTTATETHFKNLLNDGKTYVDFLYGQISALEAKSNTEGLTEEEVNKMLALKKSLKESTGGKSQTDILKEEMAAQKQLYKEDLVVYQDYLNKKMEDAEKQGNTPSGIANRKLIAEEQNKVIAEQNDAYLKSLEEFKDYNQKRNDIQVKYGVLINEFVKRGDNIAAEEARKKLQKELDSIDEANGAKVDSHKWVFAELERMGVISLRNHIARLREELNNSKLSAEMRVEIEKKLAASEEKMKDALPDAIRETSGVLGEAAKLAGDIDDNLAKAIQTASDLASGVADVVAGYSTGNYAQMAAGMVKTVQTISSMFSGPSYAEQEAARTKKLTEAINSTNDSLERQIRLTELLQGLARSSGYADAIAQTAAALKQTTDLLGKELDAYASKINSSKAVIGNLLLKEKFTNIDYKDDAGRKEISDLINKGIDNLTNADWTKLIDSAAGQQKERLIELYNDWINLQEKQKEYFNTWAEGLTGTSYDTLVGNIMEAFASVDNRGQALADNLQDMFQTALKKGFETEVVAKQLEAFYKNFANSMSDGTLTEEEKAKLTEEYNAAVALMNEKYKEMETMFPDIFAPTQGTSDSGMSGAIKGMSQDSADLLAGQFGAIRITVAEQLKVMNSSLMTLSKIEVNTRYLEAIDSKLGKMASNSSSGYGDSFRDNRINGR